MRNSYVTSFDNWFRDTMQGMAGDCGAAASGSNSKNSREALGC